MYRIGLVCAASLFCVLGGIGKACAAEAHVHGQGHLDVAVDEATLTIELEGPLDSIVGFERKPRNDKERAAVQRAAQKLRADSVFVPTPAAGCKLKEVTLTSSVLDPALLSPGQPPATANQEKGEGDGHADIDGEYVYTCSNPGALNSLEVNLFDAFPGLKRLDAQVAGPRGQTGAKLTPKSRKLSF
jgi:hypothetical protein